MSEEFFNDLNESKNINYTKQQKAAILEVNHPVLLLAVPGSGKTTSTVGKVGYLIKKLGMNPRNILILTFSKASAEDMGSRFLKLFGDTIKDKVHFSTIHSFAYAVVRAYYSMIRKPIILIEGDKCEVSKITILKNLYLKINEDYISDDKLDELVNYIGYVKNMMINTNEFSNYDFNKNVPNFQQIYMEYEDIKEKNNYLDFDDMLTKCLEIFKNDTAILNKCRVRYKYILIDEAQDTSKIQHELIKLLAFPHNRLFFVADDDQSVYSFRGAYPKFLLDFEKVYPNAKILYMEENFRSTQSIVNAANYFIKSNKDRFNKTLYTNKELGKPINIVETKNDKEQISFIIDKLQSDKKHLNDYAILYRNNISSIYLMYILDKNKIPFYIKDSKMRFFSHWVTQDIISFLKFALDGSDIESFKKIYYKMGAYLNKSILTFLKQNWKEGTSILKCIEESGNIAKYQKDIIKKINFTFKFMVKEEPYSAINDIENILKYKKYIEKNAEKNGYSVDTLNNLLSILKLIAEDCMSIREFIQRIEDLNDLLGKSKFNKNKNAVTLTTMHSSKGLEFNTVFMIDLIDFNFPSIDSINKAKEGDCTSLEEERRIFYVSMTRAKYLLYLLYPKIKSGEVVAKSRFVESVYYYLNPEAKKEDRNKIKKSDIITNKTILNADIDNLSKKSLVEHKEFGIGVIEDIKDGLYIINFKGNGIRKLSISVCSKFKLLKKVFLKDA